MPKLVKLSISVWDYQKEWLSKKMFNISKFIRKKLDEEMKEHEGKD